MKRPTLPANGWRECAPDDGLREAIHKPVAELDCFVRFDGGECGGGEGEGECDGSGGSCGTGGGGSRQAPALRPAIIQ